MVKAARATPYRTTLALHDLELKYEFDCYCTQHQIARKDALEEALRFWLDSKMYGEAA